MSAKTETQWILLENVPIKGSALQKNIYYAMQRELCSLPSFSSSVQCTPQPPRLLWLQHVTQ